MKCHALGNMQIQEREGKDVPYTVSPVLHVVNLLCARKGSSEDWDICGIIRDATHPVKYPHT
jgi:hypothetical protein